MIPHAHCLEIKPIPTHIFILHYTGARVPLLTHCCALRNTTHALSYPRPHLHFTRIRCTPSTLRSPHSNTYHSTLSILSSRTVRSRSALYDTRYAIHCALSLPPILPLIPVTLRLFFIPSSFLSIFLLSISLPYHLPSAITALAPFIQYSVHPIPRALYPVCTLSRLYRVPFAPNPACTIQSHPILLA